MYTRKIKLTAGKKNGCLYAAFSRFLRYILPEELKF
jgi:hypothetical protein